MIEIKEINRLEIKDVINIHKDAFEGFFLTSLGDHFLEIYYESVRTHPSGLILGYFDNGRLKGFAAVTLHAKGFHKSLLIRNLAKFVKIGFKLLFRKDFVILRLIKNLSKSKSVDGIKDEGDYAELLSIGISRAFQGEGIGRNLLKNLETLVGLKNVKTLSLTTDFYLNQRAIDFYNSLEYGIYYDFTAFPDRKMYRMIKKIS